MSHADQLQNLANAVPDLFTADAFPIGQRQGHIFLDRQVGDQVEGLENEADLAVADAGTRARIQFDHVLPFQRISASAGRI